mgnify:FL=1
MLEERVLHGVAAPVLEDVENHSSIVFCAGIRQANILTDILNRQGTQWASCLTEETHPDDRKDIRRRFKNSEIKVLVNVQIACLDEQTEILTQDGWMGPAQISPEHEVASWDQGKIVFAKPLAVEVRQRHRNERMVVLETKNRSIRVTEDHRMLYRTWEKGKWQVALAKDLVGKACKLPLHGVSAPLVQMVETPAKQRSSKRIVSNCTRLRNQGLSPNDATKEAKRRIAECDALRYLQPQELSLDHCRWIGFWIGDGTRSRLQTGGVEYVVSGSDQWPEIATWFEDLSHRCGFAFRKHRQQPRAGRIQWLTKWSFCRGTGFGPQHRDGGLFPIEAYLDKNGSPLLWSMSHTQFDAFLEGLWCADGNHYHKTSLPRSFLIFSSNRQLLDLLQAISACRGYRANVSWKNNHGHPLGILSLSHRDQHHMTKYRLRFEDGWRPELVWCVKSTTGFIVTRRRGTVTVTGNTEGVDLPNADRAFVARPTRSRALYSQMAGRICRPLKGVADANATPDARRLAIANSPKPFCQVIDFSGNAGRHKLVCMLDILGGKDLPEVLERAKRAAAESDDHDVSSLLNKSRLDHENERKAIRAEVSYRFQAVDPFSIAGIVVGTEPDYFRGKEITGPQLDKLLILGVEENLLVGMSRHQASSMLDKLIGDADANLATYKQRRLLMRWGLNPNVSKTRATQIIGQRIGSSRKPRTESVYAGV